MAVIISQNGKNATKIERTSFGSEDELQGYIYENPDVVPLYEIKEDVRVCILARELPTQSGPIDAVGVDRDGDIYLIETKLYKNQDKRHVVAQVLDYGASLWRHFNDSNRFIAMLEKSVQEKFGVSLYDKLNEFFGMETEESTRLTDAIRNNLDNGQFKFVILMDQLHDQLKDLILFLNQNSKFDVYAVELEYYKHDTYEIMIPKLFGAEVKKSLASPSSSARGHWDEESFFRDAAAKLNPKELEALHVLYDFTEEAADIVEWGKGVVSGSFIARFRAISLKSVYQVYSDGRIYLGFNYLSGSDVAEKARDTLYKEFSKITGITLPEDYANTNPSVKIEQWGGHVEEVKKAITAAASVHAKP